MQLLSIAYLNSFCESTNVSFYLLYPYYSALTTSPQKENVRSLKPAQELIFNLPESITSYVAAAITRFEADVARHDHKVLAYEGYGKETIKRYGMSPDTFVQLSMQLAWLKLFGEPKATYESAQTKKYAWGRTEVCRSLSDESSNWTRAMLDPKVGVLERAALGRKAASAHSAYMASAVEGHGVDRHLLGK